MTRTRAAFEADGKDAIFEPAPFEPAPVAMTLFRGPRKRAPSRRLFRRGPGDLVDVGALFLAGPIGLVVTKAYTLASLLRGSGGSSDTQTLVARWEIEQGIARAQNVAMATNQNRIALHGDLDLVDEQFDDLVIALIDANGCAKAQQKIHGPFRG